MTFLLNLTIVHAWTMLLIFAIVDDSYVLHNQLQDQINEDLEMWGWVKECSSFTTASTWLYCLSTDTNILINWGWNIFCLFYILWDCWAHPPTQATQDLQCLKKFSTFLYILETFSSGDLKAESSWGLGANCWWSCSNSLWISPRQWGRVNSWSKCQMSLLDPQQLSQLVCL